MNRNYNNIINILLNCVCGMILVWGSQKLLVAQTRIKTYYSNYLQNALELVAMISGLRLYGEWKKLVANFLLEEKTFVVTYKDDKGKQRTTRKGLQVDEHNDEEKLQDTYQTILAPC